jgi:glycosyltransferase involved in cell wall biosynthesis
LVDPENTDAIADGIARLLDDSSLRDRLRIAGHERVKQFSWDRTAQMTAEVLAAAAV